MSTDKSKRRSFSIPDTRNYEKENTKSANCNVQRSSLITSQSQMIVEEIDSKSKRRSLSISPRQLQSLQQLFQAKHTKGDKKKKSHKIVAEKTKTIEKSGKTKDKISDGSLHCSTPPGFPPGFNSQFEKLVLREKKVRIIDESKRESSRGSHTRELSAEGSSSRRSTLGPTTFLPQVSYSASSRKAHNLEQLATPSISSFRSSEAQQSVRIPPPPPLPRRTSDVSLLNSSIISASSASGFSERVSVCGARHTTTDTVNTTESPHTALPKPSIDRLPETSEMSTAQPSKQPAQPKFSPGLNIKKRNRRTERLKRQQNKQMVSLSGQLDMMANEQQQTPAVTTRQTSATFSSPLKRRRIEPSLAAVSHQQKQTTCEVHVKEVVAELSKVLTDDRKLLVPPLSLTTSTLNSDEIRSTKREVEHKNNTEMEPLSARHLLCKSADNTKLIVAIKNNNDEKMNSDMKSENQTSQPLSPTNRKVLLSSLDDSQISPRDDKQQSRQSLSSEFRPYSNDKKLNDHTKEEESCYARTPSRRRFYTDSDVPLNKGNIKPLLENEETIASNNSANTVHSKRNSKELKKTMRMAQLRSLRVFASQNGSLQQVLHWVLFDFKGSRSEQLQSIRAFVFAYKAYNISPNQLFKWLNQAFPFRETSSKSLRELQESAVDFVKEWIDSWYHQDFANDENNEMQQLLNAFYEKVNHSVVKSETIELTLRLDATRQSSPQTHLTPRDVMSLEHNEFLDNLDRKLTSSNPYDICKTTHFLEIDINNLAKQWTRTEARLFKAIPLEEFYTGGWDGRENGTRQIPFINQAIEQFNRASFWVSTEMVKSAQNGTLKEQIKKFKKFILLAKTLFSNYHNFNGAYEVWLGLSRVNQIKPETKLTSAWKTVILKQKYGTLVKELSKELEVNNNFAQYRKALKYCLDNNIVTVPLLAVYLKDIYMLLSGTGDATNVCWEQMKHLGLQLYDIWRLQKREPKVESEDTLLANMFNNMIYMSESEIFAAISKEK